MGKLLSLCMLLCLAVDSTSPFLAQPPVKRAGQSSGTLSKQLGSITSSSETSSLSVDSFKQAFGYKKNSPYVNSWLSDILVTCPELFQQREEDLTARIEYFCHELGMSDHAIKFCVRRFPRIFLLDHRDALPRRLNYLRRLGGRNKGRQLSLSQLFRVLRVMPELVDLRISQSNRKKIRYVQRMFGFTRQQVGAFIAINPNLLRDETSLALFDEALAYLLDRLDLDKTQLGVLALNPKSQIIRLSTADLREQLDWVQETFLEGDSSRLTDLVLRQPRLLGSSTKEVFQACVPMFTEKLGVTKQDMIQLWTRNKVLMERTASYLESNIDWLLSNFDVKDVRGAIMENVAVLDGVGRRAMKRHKELAEAGISVDACSIRSIATGSDAAWESWFQWEVLNASDVSDAQDTRGVIRHRFRFDPPRTERWILDLDKTHPELVAVPVHEFEARVDYLMSALGCDEKDLGLFLRRCPRIFLLDSVDGLPRRIGYLKRFWFPTKSKSQMLRLFRFLPEALDLTIPRRYAPNIRVLRDILRCSRKDVVSMLTANPRLILCTNIGKSHLELSSFLKDQYCLEDAEIARMCQKHPMIFGYTVSNVKAKIDWFHDRLMFGSPEDSIRCFVAYPKLLALDPETTLASKLDWLQIRLDSTPEEIAAIVRKLPIILACSITNNLGPKFDWVENEVGFDAMKAGVLSDSRVVCASLKGRLIPRSKEWKSTGCTINWNAIARMATYTEERWDRSLKWRLKA